MFQIIFIELSIPQQHQSDIGWDESCQMFKSKPTPDSIFDYIMYHFKSKKISPAGKVKYY